MRRWWGGALALVVAGLGLWAFWLEPASLRVVEHPLVATRWPAPLDGLRIAVLADLHVGSPWNGIEKLRRIVDETNAARPELVLLAGDYVVKGVVGGTFVPPGEIARVLRDLSAPLGVFAVLGNHDWWYDAPRVAGALHAVGIPTVDDDAVAVEGPHGRFWVVGISDFWEGPHDVRRALARVGDDAPVIAFTHNPDAFPNVPERVALTIAGHTHGGQVWLPILGRPIVPSRYGERYAIGHVVEDGRHLFVSSGLGTSIIPVRFRVPPEISIVALRSSSPGDRWSVPIAARPAGGRPCRCASPALVPRDARLRVPHLQVGRRRRPGVPGMPLADADTRSNAVSSGTSSRPTAMTGRGEGARHHARPSLTTARGGGRSLP